MKMINPFDYLDQIEQQTPGFIASQRKKNTKEKLEYIQIELIIEIKEDIKPEERNNSMAL